MLSDIPEAEINGTIHSLLANHDSEIVDLYIRALASFSRLEEVYGIHNSGFVQGPDAITQTSGEKEARLIGNIKLLVEAIDDLLSHKYSEIKFRVYEAFACNLWVHQFLDDVYWHESESKKPYYLRVALRGIFRDFEYKDIVNVRHGFMPLAAPWSYIPHGLLDSHAGHAETAKQIYSDIVRPVLNNQLSTLKSTTVPALSRRDDYINLSIRIANKLKDYKRRIFYFDVKRFDLYDKFKKLYDEQKENAIYHDFLYSFFLYEVKRATFWNSVFLLPAETFVDLFEDINASLAEQIRNELQRLPDERKSENAILLNMLRNSAVLRSEREIPIPELAKTITSQCLVDQQPLEDIYVMGMSLQSGTVDNIIMTSTYSKEYNYFSRPIGGIAKKNIEFFYPKWNREKKFEDTYFLLDHGECIGKHERDLLRHITNLSSMPERTLRFVALTDKSDAPILACQSEDSYIEQAKERPKIVIDSMRFLYPLNRFDKGLASLVLDAFGLNFSDIIWEALISENEPLTKTWDINWFYILHDKRVESEIRPISKSEYSDQLIKDICSYLRNYIKNNALSDRKEYSYLDHIELDLVHYSFLRKKSLSGVKAFVNSLAGAIKRWDKAFLDRLIVTTYEHREIINSNSSLSWEQDIIEGLNEWQIILSDKKDNIENAKLNNAIMLVEKIVAEDLEVDIKADLLSAAGNAFAILGETGKAEQFFEKAVKLAPEDVNGYLDLVLLWSKKGEKDKEFYYHKMIAERFEAYAPQAHIFMSRIRSKQEKYDEAIHLCQKAIELAPDSVVGYAVLADTYGILKKPGNQIEVYNMIAEKFKQYAPDAFDMIAKIHIKQFNHDKAVAVCKRAIKIAPDNVKGYLSLAQCYDAQGEYEKTQKVYREISDKFEEHAQIVSIEIAETYLKQLQYDKAIEECEKTIKLAPDDIKSYQVLVKVYRALNDSSQEINIHMRIAKALPEFESQAYLIIGNIFFAKQQYNKAEYFFQKTVEIATDEIEAGYAGLVALYQAQKDYTKLLEVYKSIIAEIPSLTGVVYILMGRLYSTMKKYPEAIALCNKAIDLSPDKIDGYIALAAVYEDSEDEINRLDIYNRIAIKFPEKADMAHVLNAMVYIESEQYEKATVICERVIKSSTNPVYGYDGLARIYSAQENDNRELEIHKHILSEFRQEAPPEIILKSMFRLAWIIGHQGDLETAANYYKEEYDTAKKHKMLNSQLISLSNLVEAYSRIGHGKKTLEAAEMLFATAKDMNSVIDLMRADGRKAEAFLIIDPRGKWQEIQFLLARGKGIATSANVSYWMVYFSALTAKGHLRHHDLENAKLCIDEALKHLNPSVPDQPVLESWVSCLLSTLYLNQGDYNNAIAKAKHAKALARESGDLDFEWNAKVLLANVENALGNHSKAIKMSMLIATEARKYGWKGCEVAAETLLGRAALELKDYLSAESAFRTALKISRELGTLEDEVVILLSLSETLILLERKSEGRQEIEKALKLAHELGYEDHYSKAESLFNSLEIKS